MHHVEMGGGWMQGAEHSDGRSIRKLRNAADATPHFNPL